MLSLYIHAVRSSSRVEFWIAKDAKFLDADFDQTAKMRKSSRVFVRSPCIDFDCLRPSQPNGVMSSAVSLPCYIFTGQA